MERGITWYDILGVLPGASRDEIQQAYDDKAALLRPELVSGAPSNVVAAVSRSQRFLDEALRVLGDPVNRNRYDEQAGLYARGGAWPSPRTSPASRG